MKPVMICLVGEQPVPNLLPIRYCQPQQVVLVYSKRTERVSDNLKLLLKAQSPVPCEVHPYDIPAARQQLADCLSQHKWRGEDLLFNLTGGTKPMAIAAFRVAQLLNSPCLYFQTEGNQSLLYYYTFEGDEIVPRETHELPTSISLDDYLRLYVGTYTSEPPRNDFEQQVVDTLRATPAITEVLTSLRPQGLEALEIDFVVRCSNQVGIGEVKTKGAKGGIDQINAVAEQRYLGTYIRKFLISANPVDHNNKELASAYRIEVIELLSYERSGALDEQDKQKLAEIVVRQLGGR